MSNIGNLTLLSLSTESKILDGRWFLEINKDNTKKENLFNHTLILLTYQTKVSTNIFKKLFNQTHQIIYISR